MLGMLFSGYSNEIRYKQLTAIRRDSASNKSVEEIGRRLEVAAFHHPKREWYEQEDSLFYVRDLPKPTRFETFLYWLGVDYGWINRSRYNRMRQQDNDRIFEEQRKKYSEFKQ